MKQTNVRVVPDYVALSKALQDDMLQAAKHIRNALYNHPHIETLAIALIALDFPHFIPIENTTEALTQEWDMLWEEMMAQTIFGDSWDSLINQFDDVGREITRREADSCDNHFAGGWYITTSGNRMMAVPPHMGVDADKACPKCRGWLNFPSNFSRLDGEV